MLSILQRVLEETSPVLVSARLEAEERRNNVRLREEQDAAYRAALEADQVSFVVDYMFLLYYAYFLLLMMPFVKCQLFYCVIWVHNFSFFFFKKKTFGPMQV